jgi:hypothetical protein
MYCERCEKPVAAQKTTHGVRNTMALGTMGLTAKVEGWHCPSCGGPVRSEKHDPATDGEVTAVIAIFIIGGALAYAIGVGWSAWVFWIGGYILYRMCRPG